MHFIQLTSVTESDNYNLILSSMTGFRWFLPPAIGLYIYFLFLYINNIFILFLLNFVLVHVEISFAFCSQFLHLLFLSWNIYSGRFDIIHYAEGLKEKTAEEIWFPFFHGFSAYILYGKKPNKVKYFLGLCKRPYYKLCCVYLTCNCGKLFLHST